MGYRIPCYMDIHYIVGTAIFNDMAHIDLKTGNCKLKKTLQRVAYAPIYQIDINELKDKILFSEKQVVRYETGQWYVYRIGVPGMEPLVPLCRLPANALLRVNETADKENIFLTVQHEHGFKQQFSHITLEKDYTGMLGLYDVRPGISPRLTGKRLSKIKWVATSKAPSWLSVQDARQLGFKNAWIASSQKNR